MKICVMMDIDEKRYSLLKNIGKRLNIVCGGIEPKDLSETVRSKFEREIKQPSFKEDCEGVLIFNGVPKEEIVEMIQTFGKEGEFFQGAIGTVNSNNETWIMRDLIEELKREHQVFKQVDFLHQKIQELNQYSLSDLTEEDKGKIMNAYLFLQKPEEEGLQDHLRNIEEIIEKFKK